jgi:peptidoglycan biosynthesis protein MviN/MurJ (putative lipid II flippase)
VDSLRAVFNSKNRPDIPFKFGAANLLFTFLAVGILGYHFGINGIAVSMLLSAVSNIFLLVLAFKMMQSSMRMLFPAIWPVIACTGLVAISALGARTVLEYLALPPWLVLMMAIITGCLVYVSSMMLFFQNTARGVLETINVVIGREKNMVSPTV